jgi:hypothetical protein
MGRRSLADKEQQEATMGDAHEKPTNGGRHLGRDMEHTKPAEKEILVQPDAKSSGNVTPTPRKEAP